jgi:Sulfotransferase family
MLDHHPLLAVSNDPHFVPFAPGVRDGLDPPVTPALVDWLLGYRTFRRLGLDEAAVRAAAADSRTYTELVGALYDALGRARRKPLAGEKTPRYVRYLPLLHSLFPWAKTLHLVRDGRDVALSTLEWARADRGPGRFQLWRSQPLAVCALSWRWHVSTGRRDGTPLGSSYYSEVRYEQLVTSTEQTLRGIAAFLELPYAPEMLDFHRGKTRTDPDLSAKDAWLPPTPGLRDWRAQMAPRDVELYEAIAGDLLSLLGYERAFGAISDEVATLALSCREDWEAELEERRRGLAARFDLSIPLEAL